MLGHVQTLGAQHLRQAAPKIEPQPVHEHHTLVPGDIGRRFAFANTTRRLACADQRLQPPCAIHHPRQIDTSNGRADRCEAVCRRSVFQGTQHGVICLPASGHVDGLHVFDRAGFQRLAGRLGQPGKRCHGQGQRCLTQRRPHQVAPLAMVTFQAPQGGTGVVRRLLGQRLQGGPQIGFTRIVPLRPATRCCRIGQHVEDRRRTASDLRRNVGITGRHLREALPHQRPGTGAGGKPGRSRQLPFLGLKRELGLADTQECRPGVVVPGGPELGRGVHPLQQIPHRIPAGQQRVEPGTVQTPRPQHLQRLVHDLAQGQQHALLRFLVLADIQPQPTLLRLQEGQNRPVLGVDLRKHLSAVLQLGQRPQRLRAMFDGTQVLTAHAG